MSSKSTEEESSAGEQREEESSGHDAEQESLIDDCEKEVAEAREILKGGKHLRKKLVCPICGKTLFNMPRHLVGIHGYSETASKIYRRTFSLSKSTCALLACPVPRCFFKTPRLDKHLSRRHKMSKDECKIYARIARASAKRRRRTVCFYFAASTVHSFALKADNPPFVWLINGVILNNF